MCECLQLLSPLSSLNKQQTAPNFGDASQSDSFSSRSALVAQRVRAVQKPRGRNSVHSLSSNQEIQISNLSESRSPHLLSRSSAQSPLQSIAIVIAALKSNRSYARTVLPEFRSASLALNEHRAESSELIDTAEWRNNEPINCHKTHLHLFR